MKTEKPEEIDSPAKATTETKAQTIVELKAYNAAKAREEVAAVLAKYDCRYSIKVLLSTDGNEFIINIVNN